MILADPPWKYRNRTIRGGAEHHYPTMTLPELKAMAPMVNRLAADDCALFMWATYPMYAEAQELMASWGFAYKTAAFVWVKLNRRNGETFFGNGHYTRANSEPCLIGIRGKPERSSKKVKQVIIAPIGEHSRKPNEQYRRIERLYGGRKVELFARPMGGIFSERVREGWHLWGNEISL